MYVEKTYSTVDGDLSVGWGRWTLRPPWCFSRRAGYELAPDFTFSLPFIIIPHNTITLHKQLHLQSPQPQLSPLHFTDTHPTRNVVCPSSAWFENRPHLTPSIHVVWNDDERKGEGETRCRIIACSSRKAPRGPPGLTSPSDGRIAINSIICLLNIHTAEGFGI